MSSLHKGYNRLTFIEKSEIVYEIKYEAMIFVLLLTLPNISLKFLFSSSITEQLETCIAQ